MGARWKRVLNHHTVGWATGRGEVLDQKDDFREDWSSILLWKISYTYTNEKPLLYNENPYCEACTAENMAY